MDIEWLFKIKTVKISNSFTFLQSSEDYVSFSRREINQYYY